MVIEANKNLYVVLLHKNTQPVVPPIAVADKDGKDAGAAAL